MIRLLLFICLWACSGHLFAQPQNLFANFGVLWNDYAMSDRGVVFAVKAQSPNTGIGQCLFNPAAGDWSAKWCGSTTDFNRNLNQKLDGYAYYFTSGAWDHNMEFAITTSNYYTFIIGKNSMSNNDMSILETNFDPATINSATQAPLAANVTNTDNVTVTAVLGSVLSTGEFIYIHYSTDNWVSSSFEQMSQLSLTNYSGTIPANIAGTTVKYYLLSTINNTPLQATVDFLTLNILNNGNLNYEYLVGGIDNTAPAVSILSPADNASSVDIMSDLVITFDENIQKGTGNIIIKKTSDNSIVQTIDVTTTDVIINNAVATININNLAHSTDYYVNIDATAFKDLANNNYAGIGDAISWNFTTGASTDAIDWCNFQYPQSATNIAGSPYIIFAQAFEAGLTEAAGQGAGVSAWIGYSTTNTDPSTWTTWEAASFYGQSGNNDEYNLDLGSLLMVPDTYYVASRFQLNGGPYMYGGFNGIWNGTTSINAVFTVTAADVTAPVVTTLFPADNAATVSITTDLIITFDENIQKGTGNIIIKKTSDNSIVQTIDVTTTDVAINNTVASININNLVSSTDYYVNIDATSFKDLSNNDYAGISDATSWNFTTETVQSNCPIYVSLGNDTSICGLGSLILDPEVLISPFGDSLTITYNATLGQTGLTGATKVYMHAAAELHTNGGWQFTKGNWGMDDGVGEMVNIGTDLWQITINPVDYFGYPADSSLNGIIMVFRNTDGSLTGKDNSGNDIWVNMQSNPPVSSFSGVMPLFVPNPVDSVVWSDGTHGYFITAQTSGDYWIKIFNTTEGCNASDTIHVTFGTIPYVNIGNDQGHCTGDTVILNAGTGFNSYLWSTGASTQQITVTTTGTYSVTVSNNGCNGFDVVHMEFADPPIADFSYVENGLSVSFTDLSVKAVNYFWDFQNNGSTESTVAGNVTWNYLLQGQYTVRLTVRNACDTSIHLETIFVTTGIENNLNSTYFKVFPVVTNDNITVDLSNAQNEKLELIVTSITGAEIIKKYYKNIFGEFHEIITVKDLAPGVYVLKIVDGKSVYQKKIIKTN